MIRESSQEKLKISENFFLFGKSNFKAKDTFIYYLNCVTVRMMSERD